MSQTPPPLPDSAPDPRDRPLDQSPPDVTLPADPVDVETPPAQPLSHPREVPFLVGSEPDRAQAVAAAAGLAMQVRDVSVVGSDTTPDVVAAQYPQPGSIVSQGGVVLVEVARRRTFWDRYKTVIAYLIAAAAVAAAIAAVVLVSDDVSAELEAERNRSALLAEALTETSEQLDSWSEFDVDEVVEREELVVLLTARAEAAEAERDEVLAARDELEVERDELSAERDVVLAELEALTDELVAVPALVDTTLDVAVDLADDNGWVLFVDAGDGFAVDVESPSDWVIVDVVPADGAPMFSGSVLLVSVEFVDADDADVSGDAGSASDDS